MPARVRRWIERTRTILSNTPPSAAELYALLERELRETTWISIAHRGEIARFHARLISFTPTLVGFVAARDERRSLGLSCPRMFRISVYLHQRSLKASAKIGPPARV